MKRIIGLMTACLLFSAAAAQQPDNHTQRRQAREARKVEAQELQEKPKTDGAHMRIEQPTYNFGDVARKGGDLTHDFRITNDGTVPLVITRVVTSCSCMKAAFPKRPISPGSSAVIRITYQPLKSEPGTFHKVIHIYSNSSQGRQLITVQGNSLDPDKM